MPSSRCHSVDRHLDDPTNVHYLNIGLVHYSDLNHGVFLIAVQDPVPFPTGSACCWMVRSRACGLLRPVCLGNVYL